jgi:hypothetical protein
MRPPTTTPSVEPDYVRDHRHPEGKDLWITVCTIFEALNARQPRMTQKELCRLSGVSERTLKNWRAGTSKPSFPKLYPVLLCVGYRLVPMPDTEDTRNILNNQSNRNFMASADMAELLGHRVQHVAP